MKFWKLLPFCHKNSNRNSYTQFETNFRKLVEKCAKNRDLHNINRVDPDLKIILESSLFQQAALLTDPVHQNLSRLAQLFWLLLLFLFLNFFIPLTNFIGTHFHFCWVGILVLRRRRFCIVKSPILTSVQRSNAADDYLLCICQISLSSTK